VLAQAELFEDLRFKNMIALAQLINMNSQHGGPIRSQALYGKE
jgi:hypothetical protein